MATYVDFAYYTTDYLGNKITDSADFARLAIRASRQIDRLTFGRAEPIITANTDTGTIDLIQMATCAVAEVLNTIDATGGASAIKSESVGSHSVTYGDNPETSMTTLQACAKEAKIYLAPTGLMFRSFADNEYGSVA